MRLRKSLFRTPEKIPENRLRPKGSGVQKLYFCGCGKAFFALRRKSRKTGLGLRVRSAKIIFLRLRKSIFRTPEKIPENWLRPKGSGVQKLVVF
ncbi:Uncharacterized protein dnm_043760 [Desulfonema magnum]|uniref:Uncharacterized protein n=1 Tax=Desulfonema magnum TaxID=45655 RepID=A0A975GPX2_9BACT|nr:Uncharacterized protein dnm_043760 [Desulfonema magnum]